MKIAFLNDGIYDYAFQSERGTWATGGAERQQWWLARAMAAAGWDVVAGVRRPVGPEPRRQDGVRFVELEGGHVLSAWHRFFKAERPDWWFWQCASHLFGFGVAIAHVNGVKTIFGAGVDRDVYVREALYHRPKLWPVYAYGLSRTERIVLQHRGQQDELPRRWYDKSHVVPNIVASAETVLTRAERRPTVCWIAALRVAKRPDRLVEIARLLPQVQFIVCGSTSTFMTPPGYSEAAIDAFRATPNIDYRGQISPADAERVVRESSVLLSTSQEEGFPQTFLEAWSNATPVVTLGIDPDTAIRSASLGAVCDSPAQAAAEIDSLIHDAERWTRDSSNARSYVRRCHSPEAAIAAMEATILGTHNRTGVSAASARVSV